MSSSNVEHTMEPRASASSQFPEGSAGRHSGSGDRSHVAKLERTPSQEVSSTSNATKGKRRASEPPGSMASANSGSGSTNDEMNRRKRLSFGQKLELLEMVGTGTRKAEVARRFGCSEVTVRHIAAKKSDLQRRKQSPGFNGKAKGTMELRFPQVEDKVKEMVEDARRHRLPVTRRLVMSFGRVIKTQVLASNGISEDERTRLASFGAGETWARNFIKRNSLVSKVLHGGAGDVDHEAVKEDIDLIREASNVNRKAVKEGIDLIREAGDVDHEAVKEDIDLIREAGDVNRGAVEEVIDLIREAASNFRLENIFNVGETGLFFKVLPRRTYVAPYEGQKTIRGKKDIEAEDRVSVYLCANTDGSLKVPISMIGEVDKPRCFESSPPPVTYFAQKKAWSDSKVFQRWWTEVFLPFIDEKTSGKILLIMNGCSSHNELEDTNGRVRVMHLPPNSTSVHQPMDMGVVAATKLHFRTRLLDRKATQLYKAAASREDAKRKGMDAGTAGLDQGFHPNMLDVGNLLRDAWGEVTEFSIARCWAVADILPTEHQHMIQDLRKKKGDVVCASGGDIENDDASSGVAAKHLKQSMEKVSSCLATADPKTRAAFSDLGDMLDSLGVDEDAGVSEFAVNAAVDWLNLEARKDVSRVVELERREETQRNTESNIGYRSGAGLASTSDDVGSKRKTPHELSLVFDSLHEHAMAIGSTKGQDILRRLRREYLPGSVEERICPSST